MAQTAAIYDGIFGKPLDLVVDDELQHYDVCPACGEAFDMRNLGEVMYHDATDFHDRLHPLNS